MKRNDEPPPWTAKVVETLAATPYFNILLQDVRVTDGSTRTYYTIDFPIEAVGVVPRRGTETLLIYQYRFIVDEYVWAIPSGAISAGEAPEDAGARELREETGYSAESITPLMTCYASYGCGNQRFRIFLADGLKQTEDSFDSNEVLDVRWFTEEELLDMIKRNGIVDNLSLSPLLYVLLQSALAQRGR